MVPHQLSLRWEHRASPRDTDACFSNVATVSATCLIVVMPVALAVDAAIGPERDIGEGLDQGREYAEGPNQEWETDEASRLALGPNDQTCAAAGIDAVRLNHQLH
mmetsp:Transcript_10063/g.27664  ORF Transcript_10063/g.27664 Transcript_10063/m.27664 type:complete len:105 (+) Transcript_10063:2110-2424(+)